MNEFISYLSIEKTSNLIIDVPKENDKLMVTFDITFHNLACSYISLDAMDSSGNHQIDLDQKIVKTRLSLSGSKVKPINENKPKKKEQSYCGDCYGAADKTKKCCNSCEEVREQYRKKGWTFKPEKIAQCVDENYMDTLKNQKDEGCQLSGYFKINKVRGNFHIAVGRAVSSEHSHVHDMEMFSFMNFFNLSHKINKLSFGTEFPDQINILDGREKIWTGNESAMYQYHIKIVPSEYVYLDGRKISSNQYSVTESEMSLSQSARKGIPGVFFMYDISPMLVRVQEKTKSFSNYLATLCVIIGGIFTVAGLVDNLLYKLSTRRRSKDI